MSQLASTTFSTVQDEFYASGFDYISDNSQTARAKRWINQAYQELCSLEKWPFLRTVATPAAPPITLLDLGEILSVTDGNDNFLVETDEETVATWDPPRTLTGTPSYYYLTYASGGPTVNVWPVSTDNFTITYYKNPTPLVADADVLVVPDQFIDVVVLGAVRRGYMDGTDTAQQYNITKAEWKDRLDMMRVQLLSQPRYQSVSDSSDDW